MSLRSAIEPFRGGQPQFYLAGTPKAGIHVASESLTAPTLFRAVFSGARYNQTVIYYLTVDSSRLVALVDKGYMLQPGSMRPFGLAPEHQFRMEAELFGRQYAFFFMKSGDRCNDVQEVAHSIKKAFRRSPPGRQALFIIGREVPSGEVENLKVLLGSLRYEGPSKVPPDYAKKREPKAGGPLYFTTSSRDLVFPGASRRNATATTTVRFSLESEATTGDECQEDGLAGLVAVAERIFSSSNTGAVRISLPDMEPWERKEFEEILGSAAARHRKQLLSSKP
ncbi:hypothetical protein HYU16_05060 [Candidatus Woesearchaeota archaeon]|nr:hypothetical protein [Candidatus Woesearchaeota archaeon]